MKDPRRRTALQAVWAGTMMPAAWAQAPAVRAAPVPGAEWSRADAAARGWNPAHLAEADALAHRLGSDAVLVVHRGEVVHSRGDITQPHNLYSGRKSVLGMLIGQQVDRGRIDPQATLAQLGIDDRLGLTALEKTATVRQLMQSRSGIYHPAAYMTPGDIAARPARGTHAPGEAFFYNNWDFNALATVFKRSTGQTVFEALDSTLAQPLGFQDFKVAQHTRWHTDRDTEHPAYLMHLSARDWARLGLLMARNGQWGTQTLLPAHWVQASSTAVSVEPAGWHAYSELWWVPQRAWPFWTRQPGDVLFARGNFGQYMWVDRARDLVIVHQTDGPALLRTPIHDLRVTPMLAALLAAAPA
jgi:CubicO group peptidase (beta-lactamase class C family)